MNKVTWVEAAKHCEATFGSYIDWKNRFFICPECEEPIYECDWEDDDLHYCPTCDFNFFYGEE